MGVFCNDLESQRLILQVNIDVWQECLLFSQKGEGWLDVGHDRRHPPYGRRGGS